MKKKMFLISLAILSVFFINTSCSKEKGCTDPKSINYNSDAEEDDGSCEYEGSIVFWYGKETSLFLLSDGAITLTYYIDGVVVGSGAASVYWTGAPDCGQNSSITITKDLGNADNLSYTYSIKDQNGFEYFTGVANFTANTCATIEMTF